MRIAQLIVVDIRVDLLQNPQLIVDIFILTVGDDDLKLAHDKSPPIKNSAIILNKQLGFVNVGTVRFVQKQCQLVHEL